MKIAAIIPAYNEEKTIGPVVRAARENNFVDEVIVVDDGSFDMTSVIAQESGARVVRIENNQGKGRALEKGVQSTDADILLFLDADLLGLIPQNLTNLIEPVVRSEVDLAIGTVDRRNLRRIFRWFVEKTDTPVAGQRVLKRELWEMIPERDKKGYSVETAVSLHARKKGLKVKTIILDGVRHVVKERKYGFSFGLRERLKMFGQIVLINLRLRFN